MRATFLDFLCRTKARDSTDRLPARADRLRSKLLDHSAALGLRILPLVALLAASVTAEPAFALPSFAIQTGQPCAACHIGAFGPQLTPYGRDFKLHGYTANDGQDHGLPLAVTTQTSFTHTLQPQPGGAAPGFKPNDNFAVDQLSIYYAGKIAPKLGGFVELNYDGVAQQAALNNVDIRYVSEGELFGQDVLWGITANNNPTVQDPWNSTPAWGFPYNQSALAPTPMASTLVDGGLGQRVAGVGVYSLWNDLLYLESDVYKGLAAPALTALGQVPDDGSQTTDFVPYARVALIKDFGNTGHHLEIGAYGLSANVVPGGDQTLGFNVRKTDLAARRDLSVHHRPQQGDQRQTVRACDLYPRDLQDWRARRWI